MSEESSSRRALTESIRRAEVSSESGDSLDSCCHRSTSSASCESTAPPRAPAVEFDLPNSHAVNALQKQLRFPSTPAFYFPRISTVFRDEPLFSVLKRTCGEHLLSRLLQLSANCRHVQGAIECRRVSAMINRHSASGHCSSAFWTYTRTTGAEAPSERQPDRFPEG